MHHNTLLLKCREMKSYFKVVIPNEYPTRKVAAISNSKQMYRTNGMQSEYDSIQRIHTQVFKQNTLKISILYSKYYL